MMINPQFEHVISLLGATFAILGSGLLLSGSGYLGHHAQDLLAKHTRIERPDPVAWKRVWSRLFEQWFHPFGEEVTQRVDCSDTFRGVLYQLTVGSAGMAVAISAYILISWALIGGLVASYYVAGFVPDMTPVIESVAGGAVVFGLAVTFSATERGIETVR